MGRLYGNWIEGKERLPASEAETFVSINPARTSDVLGRFVQSSEADTAEAVRSAAAAAAGWAKTASAARAAIVLQSLKELEAGKEELAQLMTREQGKPLHEARAEIGKSIAEALFMLGEAYRLNGETVQSERSSTWAQTVRVPVGPVAAITPWNFPVLTPMRKLIPALITGNPVVLKPSEYTPLTGLKLIELLDRGGLPPGVLGCVTGAAQAGQWLVSHPAIRAVTFTGSTAAGRAIYTKAAERLVRVQAEMGGKNPAVIWHPSSLEQAIAQIVSAAFLCSGQRCTAISRVIVPRDQLSIIEAAFAEALKQLVLGDGALAGVTLGPISNEAQLHKVADSVTKAVEQGARLLLGGEVQRHAPYDQGYFYPATLLSGVTKQMDIAKEEVFGPVLALQPVDSFEEAIELANDVEYGLTSAIFTADLSLAGRFVDEVQSGMVHVNHGTAPENHLPFGGVKHSAIGPGSVGSTVKDFYTDVKTVYIKHT